MATLTRLELAGLLCIENGCSDIIFNDTTGLFETPCDEDQNDNGYGLDGGIAVNDVTDVILNIYYPGNAIPFKFTFTVLSGVIQTATLTDLNLVVTNIFPFLTNTVFPLENFSTNLSTYGVLFPDITDGVFNWDYTISGASGTPSTIFSYTTSGGFLSDCLTNCCIEKSYLNLDCSCDCYNDKIKKIMKSEIFLNAARYAINVGQTNKADSLIAKAKEYCDSNCETC